MVVQLGFATRRTSAVTEIVVHAGGDQRDLRVAAVRVALVDDAVAELEQARHVSLAVLVVERDERQVAARGAGLFEPRRRQDRVLLPGVGRRLVSAGVERQGRARPGSPYEVEGLASDQAGRAQNADSHEERV